MPYSPMRWRRVSAWSAASFLLERPVLTGAMVIFSRMVRCGKRLRHRPGETVPLVVVRKGTAYKADLTFGRRGDLMSGLKYQEQTQG